MQTELSLAHGIQATLVPPISFQNGTLEVYGRSIPSAEMGGEPRELVRFQEPRYQPRFHRWDWTPDGRYLVYVKGNRQDQKSDLWRIAADGGTPQKLDVVVEGLRSLRMHPDGQRIVFSVGKSSQELLSCLS